MLGSLFGLRRNESTISETGPSSWLCFPNDVAMLEKRAPSNPTDDTAHSSKESISLPDAILECSGR